MALVFLGLGFRVWGFGGSVRELDLMGLGFKLERGNWINLAVSLMAFSTTPPKAPEFGLLNPKPSP